MLNDTDSDTFYGTKFVRYRFRDFFPIPNFTDTGSEAFSGTTFFRYWFWYYQKIWKIPGTNTGTHSKYSKFLNFGDKNQFQYQIFPIPVPRLFSCTNFFRYRLQDFFPVPNFSHTSSETFSRYKFVPIQVPISQTKKIPVPGIHGTGTSYSAEDHHNPKPYRGLPGVNGSQCPQYIAIIVCENCK